MLGERGIGGNSEIVLNFLGEAQLSIDFVMVALLIALRRTRALATLGRPRVLAIVALIVAAGGMVTAQFASPTVGERLYFAPAVLTVCALAIALDWLFAEAAVRRVALIVGGVLFAYHIFMFTTVLAEGHAENAARLALLEHAPANTVVKVPPYALWKRTRYWWGDDLQYASLREYIANEVYDLRGIEYDRELHWVEPSPHDRFVATRTFEPPLSASEDAALAPRYVPTFWEWALVQMRRSRFLGPIADVRGHRLVHYVVDDVDSGLDDPQHRPVRVFDWTPDALTFADGRQFDDKKGLPFVRVWQPSVPVGLRETFVVGCGTTTRVETQPDEEDHIGPLIPISLACRGTFSAYMCDPDTCWLAGRYWR